MATNDPTDPKSLLGMLADQMVQSASLKIRVEATIDNLVETGEIVATAKDDLMRLIGANVVDGGNGKLLFTEPYTTKDGIVRAAGQDYEFALKEAVEARPHISGHRPPPTDLERDAFEVGSKVFLKARGELVKQFGLAHMQQRAQDWGCDLMQLRPNGKRPDDNTNADPKMKKIAESREKNPWQYGDNDTRAAELRNNIIATNTALARKLSAEAGKTITNRPLLSGARRVI